MHALQLTPYAHRHGQGRAGNHAGAALIHAVALITVLAVSAYSTPAAAVALFSVSGSSPCENFATQNSLGAAGGKISDGCVLQGVYVTYAAEAIAASGGLGVQGSQTLPYGAPFSVTGALARVVTTFRITGPDNTAVPVSLNLWLTSTTSEDFAGTTLGINAGSFGSGSVVKFADGTFGGTNNGLSIPDVNCSSCKMTTREISLLTNFDHVFLLELNAFVAGPNGPQFYSGGINALNTLMFPTTGPVFNLPDGYSAYIEGMNVVDNRVVQSVNDVPEPGSFALLGLGLVGLAATRRREQKSGSV